MKHHKTGSKFVSHLQIYTKTVFLLNEVIFFFQVVPIYNKNIKFSVWRRALKHAETEILTNGFKRSEIIGYF